MSIRQGYPEICNKMFIWEWNNGTPSSELKVRYELGTVLRVCAYVQKLRREGHKLARRKRGK